MDASTHRVHGLADDAVTADWPALTVPEVTALLARYPGLGGPARIAWQSPRPLSAAALVATGAGEVFVKGHHRSVRTPATLTEEHALIAHLRAHGAPIPAVLAAADGRTAIAIGDGVYEVHAKAAGADRYRDAPSWTPLADPAQARAAGGALARLHRAAAGYRAPQRGTWILVTRDDLLRAEDPVATLAAELPRRPALAAYLAQRPWRSDFGPLIRWQQRMRARIAAQPRLWTHNDWHASNLCWSTSGPAPAVSAILDFGLASPTFALFDLTTAIERNAIAWLHLDRGAAAVFPDTACALIAGYADAVPGDAVDRELVADLLPIVHLDYALSEIEYYAGITRSAANADVAYATFLLGHFRFFDSAPGAALLAAIRHA